MCVCVCVCIQCLSLSLCVCAIVNMEQYESGYHILFTQCESDLAEAIPALEAAEAALNTLKVSNTLCSTHECVCTIVVSTCILYIS